MENKEGNKDQNYDKLLEDIGAIAQQISGMYDQAVAVYMPLVDSICSRKATSNEVEHLLDWMFGLAGDDRMLLLFKRVCRAYWQTYPESIASYIMEYRKAYDPESLIGTEYEYMLDEIGYWDEE